MNKERRKRIDAIKTQLQSIMEDLEIIQDEESEYFENMPESFQYGERGQQAENDIGTLDSARMQVEEAENALDDIS